MLIVSVGLSVYPSTPTAESADYSARTWYKI